MRYRLRAIAFATGCCLAAGPSFGATHPLRVGLAGGAGVGYLSDGSEFDEIKVTAGIAVDRGLRQGITFHTGLYWRPGGAGLSSSEPENISLALRSDYVALPIRVSYRLQSIGWMPLFVYGAAEVAYLVSAHQVEVDMNTGSMETDVTDQMSRWDIAPVLGVAVSTARGLELTLQHSWGLIGIYKDAYAGEPKNRSVWLVATLWFDLP